MLVVKAEFAVDVFFLIFECDGRSLLSYVVKIWMATPYKKDARHPSP